AGQVVGAGAGPVQVGERSRQPGRQRGGGRAAVETVDQGLAVAVVPEADAAGQARLNALPQAGDGGGAAGRGRWRVTALVADRYQDGWVARVSIGVRPADAEGAAAGDDAGRSTAVAPVDGGSELAGEGAWNAAGEGSDRAAERGARGRGDGDSGCRQDLGLDGADVHRAAEAGEAALVGGERLAVGVHGEGIVAGVDGWAAGGQGHRQRRAAVVLGWTEGDEVEQVVAAAIPAPGGAAGGAGPPRWVCSRPTRACWN